MVVATPAVAATIPSLGVVGWIVQRVYLRTSRQVHLMDLEAKAPLCTHFLETLAGIVTIRSFGWSEAYKKRNDKYLDESQVPFYLLNAIQSWLDLVLELMAGLVTAIVGVAVALRTKIDAGFLCLALVSAMDIGFMTRILIVSWTQLETSLSAVQRIGMFSKTPSENQNSSTSEPPTDWSSHGSIHFHHLIASYAENGHPVLDDVDLSVCAGEKIGVCGRIGSGKSSLVATLFGLLYEQSGEIIIDNIPTTAVSLSLLLSGIIALPQEPFFLRGTARFNLAPTLDSAEASSISDTQMQEALQRVQLWEKLNNASPAGNSALDVSLDNVESLFSQGERQLFCLARAILMTGNIVALDEATSSVDATTDALMQQIFRSSFADRTIIAITHRLDTILDFDRIIVMDAGRIAEVGPPDELLKTEGSLFKALVESQGKK